MPVEPSACSARGPIRRRRGTHVHSSQHTLLAARAARRASRASRAAAAAASRPCSRLLRAAVSAAARSWLLVCGRAKPIQWGAPC